MTTGCRRAGTGSSTLASLPRTCGSSTCPTKSGALLAATIDFEYRFGFPGKEWGELMGVANRTDYDLSSHTEASGQNLTYFDQASGERYTPYVMEPSFGLTRAMMAFLVDAYVEEEVPNAKGGTDTRTVLKLDPRLAPVKVAVLPLSRNERLSPRRARSPARFAETGPSTSTTPAPLAVATVAKMRLAPRIA